MTMTIGNPQALHSDPLPQQLAQRDSERLRRYQQHLDFYQGRQWPGAARQRRLTFNYAKVVIDKVTSYLMGGTQIRVPPTEETPEGHRRSQAAEEALRRVWEENDLEQLDFETELDTAILGDGCYKVTWDAEEGRVRVTAPDLQGLFAWWREDDPSRVWRVATRYRLEREAAEDMVGQSLPIRATEVAVTEVWTARELQVWVEESLVVERPNPYGFLPFVLFPNLRAPKEFWGVSDLVGLVEPGRELNRAFTQLSSILELSGNPIAVLENIEESHDIAVQPGAVWELPEHARAYLVDLLQGGGIRLHVDYIDLLYRTIHDLTETPRSSFGDNSRSLSGVALEMELHPLLQKVRRKRLIRTAAYRRRNELILRLLEQKTGVSYAPYRTQLVWGPVLPQDRSRLVADEVASVQAGLRSRRGAMSALGIETPDAEFERWLAEERQRSSVVPPTHP